MCTVLNNDYSVFDCGCGTSSQLTPVAVMSPTSMGCRTATPTRAPSTPVMMGNSDPPICAKTKTNDTAVVLMSAGKILVPTDMAS